MKRIWHLDLVRVICILWIVAIWHNDFNIHNNTMNFLGNSILGAFTLLSGLLLGSKQKSILNIKDIYLFWWKRLKRLYPFFFLSALLCLLIPYLHTYVSSFSQFIHTITLSSCFCNDMPATLWYVCMIFIFYFITPFMFLKESKIYKISISILFLIIFIFLFKFNFLDERLLLFWPIYSLGIIIGIRKNFNIYILLLLFIFDFLLFYLYTLNVLNKHLLNIIFIISSSITIEYICRFTNNIKINEKFYKLIINTSYASMLMYLFHRHYFLIIKGICKISKLNYSLMNIIFLPLFILCCYYVQKWYDKLLKKA